MYVHYYEIPVKVDLFRMIILFTSAQFELLQFDDSNMKRTFEVDKKFK